MNDEVFMLLAKNVARLSDDPSRQTSCVLIRHGNVVAADANRFPYGINKTVERLERPLKYSFIEHAERNVIALAARHGLALEGCTAYMPWFPCVDCSRALVNAGIVRVVVHEPDWNEERYGFNHSLSVLKEGGIAVDFLPGSIGEAK